MPKTEFHFEVEQNFDTISKSESSTGNQYTKEINLISYNDSDPVYDIRNWTIANDGSRRMGKGITFSLQEMKQLKIILNEMEDLQD